MTHEDGHKERPTGQAQAHWRWQAIDVDGVEAEQHSEKNAREDGGKFGFLQHLHRIAEPLCGRV
jgi:hypothetical protein